MTKTLEQTKREMFSRSFSPRQWFEERDWEDEPQEEGRKMYVYRRIGLSYVVGFYTPDKEWVPEESLTSPDEAAQRVHWLNGGSPA